MAEVHQPTSREDRDNQLYIAPSAKKNSDTKTATKNIKASAVCVTKKCRQGSPRQEWVEELIIRPYMEAQDSETLIGQPVGSASGLFNQTLSHALIV